MTTTRINADFSQRVTVLPEDYQWVESPIAGVERMMLDRIGDEVARATSIVRYRPDSHFTPHTHGGGEEYLVLEGVFSDEHGDYPAGTYVRNPIGTAHTPRIGSEGATIFVKLRQFDTQDTEQKVIRAYGEKADTQWHPGLVEGLSVLPLHEFGTEHVALVRWAPNIRFSAYAHWSGEEILVLEGTLYDEHGTYPTGSWLRSPHLSEHRPFTREDGALIYVKTGHLSDDIQNLPDSIQQ